MHHAEERLGIKAGGTTPDGLFTLEHAECQAACTEAPCLQVNYRYRYRVTHRATRRAVRRPARRARLDGEIPPHGTLARVRQHIPADRGVGAAPTRRTSPGRPPWIPAPAPEGARTSMHAAVPPYPARAPASSPATGRRSSPRASSYDDSLHARALPRHRRLRGPQGGAGQDAAGRCTTRSSTATVLGRGGAGFPAGVKWGLTPQGVWPRYLVVNGDESEPGTYKDRLLMELDPHQLIEGCLIACYAAGLSQCFLYIRGEMAARPGARRHGAQRGLRRRLRRQEHPRHRLLRRHRHARGAPAPTSSARRRR